MELLGRDGKFFAYEEQLAEGARHCSQQDYDKAVLAFRKSITLRPDEPTAYYNLGAALANSGHDVEAVQQYLEAKERSLVGSKGWAAATAAAFALLTQKECRRKVATPEWWNDEGLKALSAEVVRAAPNEVEALQMLAMVMSGQAGWTGDFGWQARPRWPAELEKAATHFERAAALQPDAEVQAYCTEQAKWCYDKEYATHIFQGKCALAYHPLGLSSGSGPASWPIDSFREAIELSPNRPDAYMSLGHELNNSRHFAVAAPWFLEAKKRYPEDSKGWAEATAWAFDMLVQEARGAGSVWRRTDVVEPEWWNDEELKTLSVRVVRAAPDHDRAHLMRAHVLRGRGGAWEAGPRSSADLEEAATHYELAAAYCPCPVAKDGLTRKAAGCRVPLPQSGQAAAM